ncbi:MAG: hypothetical protein R2932_03010 [Caldilineaceae bacterium]
MATLQAAIVGGADSIVLCDTNGGMLPWQVGEAVDAVRSEVLDIKRQNRHHHASGITLGMHAHNDSGTGRHQRWRRSVTAAIIFKARLTATASVAAMPTW